MENHIGSRFPIIKKITDNMEKIDAFLFLLAVSILILSVSVFYNPFYAVLVDSLLMAFLAFLGKRITGSPALGMIISALAVVLVFNHIKDLSEIMVSRYFECVSAQEGSTAPPAKVYEDCSGKYIGPNPL